jgi:hypothetical protein
MKVTVNAGLAIRVAILTVGMMMFASFAASTQPVPTADGGLILVCAPKQMNCLSQPATDGQLASRGAGKRMGRGLRNRRRSSANSEKTLNAVGTGSADRLT